MESEELGNHSSNNPTDMPGSGSCACFSKQTIQDLFECALACTTYPSFVYILLLIVSLVAPFKLLFLFQIIGYISLFSVVITPLGFYGSIRNNYCTLFTFFILASYHLYALAMYFWFDVEAPMFHDKEWAKSTKDFQHLHYILSGSYTVLVALSVILVVCRISSLVGQIEPAKVIVVDNNPSD